MHCLFSWGIITTFVLLARDQGELIPQNVMELPQIFGCVGGACSVFAFPDVS